MRSTIKTCANLLTCLSVSLLLIGCGAASRTATYSPGFALNATSGFSIGNVIDAADPAKRKEMPADFNPSAELKLQLEKKLANRGLAVGAGGPDAIAVIPTITDYDPGNAAVRWIAPGAGETVLTVKCNLQQRGADVGTIDIRRTVAFGGLYTIGEWKTIFETVANDFVAALQEKIKQGA